MTDQHQKNTSVSQVEEDEIDLIALAKTLWNGRRTVIKTTLIFMAIGLFVAIFSEKEYTASTTFVPQTSESKIGGNIGGLAAMAGINLGGIGGDTDISTVMYQQILNSIPFEKELLATPLSIEGERDKVTLKEYYAEYYKPSVLASLKKYTIGLPRVVINLMKNRKPGKIDVDYKKNDIQIITSEEGELIKKIKERVKLEVNEKDEYVKIITNMPEPVAAAELAKRTQELLQSYIINFKIKKSLDQLEFIEARYKEKEESFKNAQRNLANYRDKNKFVQTAQAQTRLDNLETKYDLAYSVFLELAKQLEGQRIKVRENTPIFTVLKPVVVPYEKSKPQRALIVVLWFVLGVIFGVLYNFSKTKLVEIKNLIVEN